jgi:hypothetical protein
MATIPYIEARDCLPLVARPEDGAELPHELRGGKLMMDGLVPILHESLP